MKRDEIIRMAREAGFGSNSLGVTFTSGYLDNHLERFAALVAAAEREACAKVCDEHAEYAEKWGTWGQVMTFDRCAVAIRARGQE